LGVIPLSGEGTSVCNALPMSPILDTLGRTALSWDKKDEYDPNGRQRVRLNEQGDLLE